MPIDGKFKYFHREIAQLNCKKQISVASQRKIWSSKRGLCLLGVIYTSVAGHFNHL